MTDGLTLSFQNLLEEFLRFLPSLLAALVIFFAGIYLAALLSRLVRGTLERRHVNAEATQVITQITRWALIVLVSVTALEQINFDLTAFVAGLGIVGFTLGFALKDISENFVAGLMLLLQRPFDLGDVVEIDDFRGRVLDVSLRATEMETMDGHNVILPNSVVYTNAILNYSRNPLTRIGVEVGVAYDTDLDQARQVALAAISRVEGVLDEPEPFVRFHTFGDSSINFTLFYWVDGRSGSIFQAPDLGVPVIKRAFQEAGIDIPFPIRTVYMAQ